METAAKSQKANYELVGAMKIGSGELEPEDPRWCEFNPRTKFEAVVKRTSKVPYNIKKFAPAKPKVNVSVSKQGDTVTFKPMVAPTVEFKHRIYKTMDEALVACRYVPAPKCPKCGSSHGPQWVCVKRDKTETVEVPKRLSMSTFKMTPEALKLIGKAA